MVEAAKKLYRRSGNTCLNSGTMARNKLVSAMLGYGLKMANIPRIIVSTASGCDRMRIESPPT